MVLVATALVIVSTARRDRATPDAEIEDELEAATERAT